MQCTLTNSLSLPTRRHFLLHRPKPLVFFTSSTLTQDTLSRSYSYSSVYLHKNKQHTYQHSQLKCVSLHEKEMKVIFFFLFRFFILFISPLLKKKTKRKGKSESFFQQCYKYFFKTICK